jgi:hypothetical protein
MGWNWFERGSPRHPRSRVGDGNKPLLLPLVDPHVVDPHVRGVAFTGKVDFPMTDSADGVVDHEEERPALGDISRGDDAILQYHRSNTSANDA